MLSMAPPDSVRWRERSIATDHEESQSVDGSPPLRSIESQDSPMYPSSQFHLPPASQYVPPSSQYSYPALSQFQMGSQSTQNAPGANKTTTTRGPRGKSWEKDTSSDGRFSANQVLMRYLTMFGGYLKWKGDSGTGISKAQALKQAGDMLIKEGCSQRTDNAIDSQIKALQTSYNSATAYKRGTGAGEEEDTLHGES
ncbi:uncharacterized protein I206_101779 [Kwoniella pini CBS 10737]|uniref:Uncharacterized protein n=1 Tax=Kwoniella pini CBS 10737 TaxID=1296096 RepID=A0A1B9HVR4_9TREE|nr:uncharacterized protein I206_06249 [Kwoniella pini CBS 10737]OCF47353.1 hypothetical protein I206_06249 [Kwoniella pini CBS 10737]